MELLFSDVFVKSLKKYRSLKKSIKLKVNMIAESPIALGEPLKGNFRGYYSCPVRRNFLIIFIYCKVCRKKADDKIVLCNECDTYLDDNIKFIDLGPHDHTYGKKLDRI